MLTGAMLGLMEQLGLDILTLTEELNETEFFASRLTRTETLRLLRSMTKTAANLPAGVRDECRRWTGRPGLPWQKRCPRRRSTRCRSGLQSKNSRR